MRIEDIDNKIYELEKLKKILKQPMSFKPTIQEIIYKSYLELENVTKVTRLINEKGYRKLKGDQKLKFNTNDISEILTKKTIDIDLNLKDLVQKIFKKNKKGAGKRWF